MRVLPNLVCHMECRLISECAQLAPRGRNINPVLCVCIKMLSNSLKKTCFARMILILLVGSSWKYLSTTSVHARPVILPHIEAEKAYSNNESYSVTLPDDSGNAFPSEVQKAVCTITAGDIKASAEAVTTKELKGVCRSDELNTALSNMELRLVKHLDEIKHALTSLIYERCYSREDNKTNTIVQFQPIPNDGKGIYNTNEVAKDYRKTTKQTSTAMKQGHLEQSSTTPMREREILIYNNTLLSEKNLRLFSYYWKVENISRKFEDGSGVTVESPVFTIKARAFRIKASFQHLHRDFLFLQLEDATLLAKSGNSISLETGGLFKEIQNNTFKYKISVLHQNAQRIKDLVSQDFDDYDSGFLIPNSALLDSPFVKEDAVLIKIVLYL